jgi:hypothetical protein
MVNQTDLGAFPRRPDDGVVETALDAGAVTPGT